MCDNSHQQSANRRVQGHHVRGVFPTTIETMHMNEETLFDEAYSFVKEDRPISGSDSDQGCNEQEINILREVQLDKPLHDQESKLVQKFQKLAVPVHRKEWSESEGKIYGCPKWIAIAEMNFLATPVGNSYSHIRDTP